MSDALKKIRIEGAVRGAVMAGRRYNIPKETVLSHIMAEYELSKSEAENYMRHSNILEIVKTAIRSNASIDEILSNIMEKLELSETEAKSYIQQISEKELNAAAEKTVKTALRYNIPVEEIISDVKKELELNRAAE